MSNYSKNVIKMHYLIVIPKLITSFKLHYCLSLCIPTLIISLSTGLLNTQLRLVLGAVESSWVVGVYPKHLRWIYWFRFVSLSNEELLRYYNVVILLSVLCVQRSSRTWRFPCTASSNLLLKPTGARWSASRSQLTASTPTASNLSWVHSREGDLISTEKKC